MKHGRVTLNGGTSALLYLLKQGGSLCGVTSVTFPSNLGHELSETLFLHPTASGLVSCVVRVVWGTCPAPAFCAPCWYKYKMFVFRAAIKDSSNYYNSNFLCRVHALKVVTKYNLDDDN